MKVKNIGLVLIASVAGTLAAGAKVTLPHILSTGMVVQRDAPLTLWGTADPGETFTVKVAKGKKVEVTADSAGNWHVELPALKPGGPYTVTVGDITLDNVMSGEVLLCSGQSNMELPVRRVTDMFASEVASYSNPSIRQFLVPKEFDFHAARTDTDGSWTALDPQTALDFSALAYFTALKLNAETGLPVGIINASWGGTPVESWISDEYLADYPALLNKKREFADDGYRDRIKKLEGENYHRWNTTIDANDPGLNGPVKYYSPSLDDSGWTTVMIPVGGIADGTAGLPAESWATDGLNPVNGSHWFRRSFTLPDSLAGREGVVRMGCIVDADSVWVNGTFVGSTGYQYPPRIYPVPAGVLKAGDNNVTVRLISQNGPGHFVPDKPYLLAVAGDTLSLRGEWRYSLGAPMPHGPGMEFWCYYPTTLYNAMIAPVTSYPVGNVVWYQGESNVTTRNTYAGLLKQLIANWRADRGNPALPFHIVELADFMHPSRKADRAAWDEMRRVQARVADETDGVSLVRNSDLGEWNDIHPLDKKTLGSRVADSILRSEK